MNPSNHKKRTKGLKSPRSFESPQNRIKARPTNNTNVLIARLVKDYSDRSRKDIKKWREALKQIEDPYFPERSKYHDIVKDLQIDGHYMAQRQVRVLSAMSSAYRIVDKEGKEDIGKTKLLRTPWFRKIMKAFFLTGFDGFGLLEITQIENGLVKEIKEYPKGRLLPEKKEVKLRGHEIKGHRWDDPLYEPYMIELGPIENLGIMADLAPLLIFKRNAMQAWAEFAQLFGMPLRTATTNKRDKESLDLIEKMMQQMGQAAYGVFPEGTTLQLVENTKTDSFNVYDKQIERCNSEVSKAIIGGTMLTDNGSSRSQSEVHFKVADFIVEADMTDFTDWANFYLLPRLARLGYPFRSGEMFEFDLTESLGKKEQWEVVNGVLQHYDVEPEWIESTFGIPVTPKQQSQNTDTVNFPEARLDNTALPPVPKLYGQCCGGVDNGLMNGAEEVADELNQWEKEYRSLFEAIFEGTVSEIPANAYLLYASLLNKGFLKGFNERLTDIAYDSPDHYKTAMYQANIFQFSAAGSWEKVQELNQLAKATSTFEEFKREAEKRVKVVRSQLYTEYVTAEATAQNAANWLRQVGEKELFDLQYFTSGDNRVRDSHRRLDGFRAPVDDPVWDSIYPPNDWACRCEVVQTPATGIRSPIKEADLVEAVGKGFNGNKGKTNFIFEANHSYFKSFDERNKKGKPIDYPEYGLSDMTVKDRKGFPRFATDDMAEADFLERFKKKTEKFGGKSFYESDFLGRSFEVNYDRFKSHFRKKPEKGERFAMLDYLGEVLKNPDEVWMKDEGRKNNRFSAKYIKNYSDRVAVVVVNAEDNQKLEVVTWYSFKGERLTKDLVNNERKGIPLKG